MSTTLVAFEQQWADTVGVFQGDRFGFVCIDLYQGSLFFNFSRQVLLSSLEINVDNIVSFFGQKDNIAQNTPNESTGKLLTNIIIL